MNIRILLAAVTLSGSPVAALETIEAAYLGYSPASRNVTVSILAGPQGDEPGITIGVGRFRMQKTGGTSDVVPLGGTLTNEFLAFCVEPYQFLANSTAYDLVPLSQGTNSIGGMGGAKANLLRELFGRFAPSGGSSASMTRDDAAAFQVAIWEIVTDTSLSLTGGNFTMLSSSNATIFNRAQGWLDALDGTGPLVTGLRVLRNGSPSNIGQGSQDLLVFTNLLDPVPEPDTWAMLIAGFGLTGAVMRRRRRVLDAGVDAGGAKA